MENSLIKNPIKCGGLIKVLTIISCAFSIIGLIPYWWILYGFSPTPLRIIRDVIFVTPFVLFPLYIFAFHKKGKATFLFPISFGMFVLDMLVSALSDGFRFYYFSGLSSVANLLVAFLLLSAYILVILSSIKGFSKPLLIIGISILYVINFFRFINWFFIILPYYEGAPPIIMLITDLCYYIGTPLFFIVVLIFGLTNKLRPKKAEPQFIENPTPAQALKTLKENFEQGNISEEEYNTARANIISKL